MTLDLSSLKDAVTSLDQVSSRAEDKKLMGTLDKITCNAIKAGVVQNFEFTFELCWKFIQRWIRANRTPEDANPLTRKDLFRMAAKFKLIKDPLPWFEFSNARNVTSHTYNEKKADYVYNTALLFLDDAKFLLTQLEKLND